ncbi:MAG: hypothetical protein H0Z28_06840 [Archaeoglobus sp.]|nr:hypothetical protein [Archaeoglobus sp.]
MKISDLIFFLKGFLGAFKKGSTEMIEYELRELENIFALVQMGFFIGIPSPPPTIIIRTLPHMAREIFIMTKRVSDDDALAEMAGVFDIT